MQPERNFLWTRLGMKIACKVQVYGLHDASISPPMPATSFEDPMRPTDFTRMRCPVARAMAILGERWTILILREAFAGTTRFDAFQRNLGIAPNILSARLAHLTEHGMVERVPDGGRHAYRLTDRGRDAFPLYLAIRDWGVRHFFAGEGPPTVMLDTLTGTPVTAPLPRRADGSRIEPEDVRILPGPGANEAIRRRFGKEPGDE
jgi:DNA-binding HxlR family transcriptional regulator